MLETQKVENEHYSGTKCQNEPVFKSIIKLINEHKVELIKDNYEVNAGEVSQNKAKQFLTEAFSVAVS